MATENTNRPHTITSSLEQRRSLTTSSETQTERATAIAAIITKLSLHYWRPDFTPGQAKLLIGDFVEDLAEFRIAEIETAIVAYRRNSANQFFPKPAQLREIIYADRKEERERTRYSGTAPPTRPHMWWLQPRALWRPDWYETEIPKEERP